MAAGTTGWVEAGGGVGEEGEADCGVRVLVSPLGGCGLRAYSVAPVPGASTMFRAVKRSESGLESCSPCKEPEQLALFGEGSQHCRAASTWQVDGSLGKGKAGVQALVSATC